MRLSPTIQTSVRVISLAFAIACLTATATAAEITRIWLSHRANDPSKLVVNWESPAVGDAEVQFAAQGKPPQKVKVDEQATLHHVEIPLAESNTEYRYSVRTGEDRSAEAIFKSYPTDTLRVAIVADWQGKPNLDAILKDGANVLMTAGDNIPSLHGPCPQGVTDCTKPYSDLIDKYPQLFRSIPFMPALGNHDREIRPRGDKPPVEPVYDVDATAFRKFFELPGDEWKWQFDLPAFGVRFIALDLNHIQDFGTTWQTCHAYDPSSEQFRWYEKLMTGPSPPFVVTIYNENNSAMRKREGGAWGKLFPRGTIAVTGFGYYAERAEVDGFSYYNTSLGVGAKYPDAQSKFFESTGSYVLLTIRPEEMVVELKNLEGKTLDRKQFAPRGK